MSRFVVQKHHARTLHYDFRLEIDGVLASWAVPKGLPTGPGIRRLAVRVEDHDLDYIDFEGEIEEGSYGAGTVEIWDSGDYELLERERGKLKFILKGKRLKGTYDLINFKEKNWLLIKEKKR
jgi:bifunctional non-homologous end joining protein LigD